MQVIQVAYSANLVLLVPIAVPTVFRLFPTDQSRFEESQGWKVLVRSLWSSILILSALGLSQPLRYSPMLLLQLIYKSVWLAVYVVPRLLRGDAAAVPWGMPDHLQSSSLYGPSLFPGQTSWG